MVRAALARHPAVLAPPETALFEGLHADAAQRWGDLDAPPEHRPLRQRLGFTRRQQRELFSSLQAWLPASGRRTRPAPLRTHAFKREFFSLLDLMAAHACKDMWLEASPGHVLYLREIDRHAPGARYVHVIRRGTDVLASMLDASLLVDERNAFGSGVMRWARRWTRAMQIHQLHAAHPNHYLLFIDDLFERPQEEWRRLCAFLELDADPLLAQLGDDGVQTPADSHDTWMLGFRHLPRHRTETLLSPSMQRWLHGALHAYDQLRDDMHSLRGHVSSTPVNALSAASD